MNQKGQSAVEFLAVYTWTFVILTIMVAVVAAFLITKSPTTYVPPTCYLSVDISCQNLVLWQNSTGATAIAVYYFNSPPSGVTLSAVNSFSVEPAFSQLTYFGVCNPQVVSVHTYVTCNASMKGYRPGIGAQVNLQFITTWSLCNGKFAGCQSYNTSGTGTVFVTSASGNFLNRITVNVICATCGPTVNGIMYIDGGSFTGGGTSNPTFIGDVKYSIYATSYQGHTFNSWTNSMTVIVGNVLSQSTTAYASNSGTLTAHFN